MQIKSEIHIYQSLDKLPILTFWDVLRANNVYLLDFDYIEGKKYPHNLKLEIDKHWNRLYDEYYILRDDSKSKFELTKGFEGMLLKARILNLSQAIEHFRNILLIPGFKSQTEIYNIRKEMYATMQKIHPKIKFQLFNSLELDIDYLMKFKNSLQNSYNINYKSIDKVYDDQLKNVYDVVASVESWLERSLPIEDVTASRWIAYEKQVIKKQIAANNGKQ